MPECFDWHPAWDAQALPRPWLRVDDVLSNRTAMAGFHRMCSNGSMVTHGDMHMAAAANCCVPRRPDGRIVWTDVVGHMLLDDHASNSSRRADHEQAAGDGEEGSRRDDGHGSTGCACAWSSKP